MSIMSSALLLTEKHSTQIELLRRKLANAPEPSASTRRVTFLQGIAKATEFQKDNKPNIDEPIKGWDTDAVEDLWQAVLNYIREMGSLLSDVAGLKEVNDRAVDKAAVNPHYNPL
jgi:hypothetical protein